MSDQSIPVPASDPEPATQIQEIPPVELPSAWDDHSDVVIVGGGGAGLCAAAAALRNGASVTILEKQATTGGHSQHAGAAASFNTAAAKRRRLHSKREAAFRHAYAIQSNGSIDSRLLATLIDRAHEVYDWSETQSWGKRWDAMTLGFIPDQGVARMIIKGTMPDSAFTAGTQLVAQMYPWMAWLADHVAQNGGAIRCNTAAEALVRDGDTIVGVKAKGADGRAVFIKADKAVILAGSGFTNNPAMIKKYCPEIYEKAVGTFLPPSDTGEAVRMALGAGADLAGTNSWTAFAGGIPFSDTAYTGKPEPGPWYQYLRQGWLQLARGNGWLEINAECDEFIPDAAHADYELHPKAIAAQRGGASYVIFDAEFARTIWETLPPPMLDDRPMTPGDPEYPWFGRFQSFMPRDWLASVDRAIQLGGIKRADTIEALAEQLRLDPDLLASAVSRWNAKGESGEPDEFGRLPQNMKPVRTAPFYGIKTGPLIAGIFCGPRVNYRLEVLDAKRRPIPGLFAAGLTAGGTNGEGMFNATVLSNVGLAFSTGWIAGDNATATRPAYEPTDMNIESEVGAQRMLNHLNRRYPRVGATVMRVGFAMSAQRRRFKQQRSQRGLSRRQRTPRDGGPARFAPAFRAANTVVLPILKSPAHPVLSGRLMVLEYVGSTTGHRYAFPVGYFPWDGHDVLAFSSGTWPRHVRRARSVRLLIGGRWYPAKPEVIAKADRKADLLAEFTRRNGPRAAKRLMLGLPGDRPGTRAELLAAAGRSTITRFARTGPPG